jgi:hypothetical protein
LAARRNHKSSRQMGIIIEKGRKPWTRPELSERELAAIGFVVTQWSTVEHGLLEATLELAERAQRDPPAEALALSFTTRLGAYRSLAQEIVTDAAELARLTRLIGRIANAEDRRHKVIHGLWTWDMTSPNTTTVMSFRPPHIYDIRFDTAALIKLAQQMGELHYELQFGSRSPWKVMAEAERVNDFDTPGFEV